MRSRLQSQAHEVLWDCNTALPSTAVAVMLVVRSYWYERPLVQLLYS